MAAGCSIPFSLNTTNSTNVDEAKGRYKQKTSSNWINFNIDLDNIRTPIIAIQGDYDLQVSVRQSGGQWSPWYSSEFFIECDAVTPPITLNTNDITFSQVGLSEEDSSTQVLIFHTPVSYINAQNIELTKHEELFRVVTTIDSDPTSQEYEFIVRAPKTEVISGSGNLELEMVVPNISQGYVKLFQNSYLKKYQVHMDITVEMFN